MFAALSFLSSCANQATTPIAANTAQLEISCQMQRTGDSYSGSCNVPCSVDALAINFNGVDAKRACESPPRVVSVSLARANLANRWLGNMQGVQPEDPTRFEVVTGNGEITARMPFGWFSITTFDVQDNTIVLRVDASKQVRPNRDDLAIIDRALNLLSSDQVWNKNDNRQCPPNQKQLSLFCALTQATTEISGGVHYRQPAMQAVREELNRVDASRIKTHRIMDYNNHPDTQLSEIHALLIRARARVGIDMR